MEKLPFYDPHEFIFYSYECDTGFFIVKMEIKSGLVHFEVNGDVEINNTEINRIVQGMEANRLQSQNQSQD